MNVAGVGAKKKGFVGVAWQSWRRLQRREFDMGGGKRIGRKNRLKAAAQFNETLERKEAKHETL